MSDTLLTLKDIEDFFWRMTTEILGFDPDDPDNQNIVRINWQPDGAPAWKRTEDVVFLNINNPDDPITYQRDTSFQSMDDNNAKREVRYTRVHSVKWILYGPNSFDNAEKIKNALYKDDYRLQYNAKNLYLILDIVPPYRLPELFVGQWWERSDFSAHFNEKVILQDTVPYITGTDIQIYSCK